MPTDKNSIFSFTLPQCLSFPASPLGLSRARQRAGTCARDISLPFAGGSTRSRAAGACPWQGAGGRRGDCIYPSSALRNKASPRVTHSFLCYPTNHPLAKFSVTFCRCFSFQPVFKGGWKKIFRFNFLPLVLELIVR